MILILRFMTQQVITCLWYRVGTKCTLLCTFIGKHFVSFLSMVKILLGECLANSQGSWVIVVCIFLKKEKRQDWNVMIMFCIVVTDGHARCFSKAYCLKEQWSWRILSDRKYGGTFWTVSLYDSLLNVFTSDL